MLCKIISEANCYHRSHSRIHRYPYWNASLGMDHFYVCAHDMGTEMAQLADPALWKNSIGLVNTADASEPSYVPHKDISVPPHPGRGKVDWALIGQGGATFDPARRKKLAFLAGEGSRYFTKLCTCGGAFRILPCLVDNLQYSTTNTASFSLNYHCSRKLCN